MVAGVSGILTCGNSLKPHTPLPGQRQHFQHRWSSPMHLIIQFFFSRFDFNEAWSGWGGVVVKLGCNQNFRLIHQYCQIAKVISAI